MTLDLLHKEDFVSGDLREANVLYSPKDGGRAFLVDFDGVGKHGKDRYSSCLNTKLGLGWLGGRSRTSHTIRRTLSGPSDALPRGFQMQIECSSKLSPHMGNVSTLPSLMSNEPAAAGGG
jgi:hypothetical protein